MSDRVETSENATSQAYTLDRTASPLENALTLARIAQLAYGDGAFDPYEDLRDINEAEGAFRAAYPSIHTFQVGRVQGLAAGSRENVVLAFSGSRGREDWWDNLHYMQVSGFGGKAHKGFAQLLDSVWDRVLATFYDLEAHERTLWVTGHSLGGALAALAAWRFHDEGIEPHLTATFGAPPLFDERAAEAYAPPLLRVVNDGDWVPHLRWPRLASPYRHTGEEVFLLRSGAPAPNRYPRHLASRLDRIDRFLEVDTERMYGGPVVDHMVGEYVARIERALNSGS